jgi:nitrite reductase/ring-hydroxylating ferredoxin subunit
LSKRGTRQVHQENKTREGRNKAMAEKFVAKSSELKDGDRRVIFVGDNEIGVFRHDGKFYAYSNFCLHQGGPACEGLTIAKVEERIMPDKTSRGLYFSDTEMHFVCPWHGMEYDMKTGECVSDRKMKLKKYKVVQKGDDVYVVA